MKSGFLVDTSLGIRGGGVVAVRRMRCRGILVYEGGFLCVNTGLGCRCFTRLLFLLFVVSSSVVRD